MKQIFCGHLPRKLDPTKEDKILYVNIYSAKQINRKGVEFKAKQEIIWVNNLL